MTKRNLIACLLMCLCVNVFAQPRAEYPRPQFERDAWVNLNGEWTYELDLVKTGHERKHLHLRANYLEWSTRSLFLPYGISVK